MEMKSWEEFSRSGMLWWVNRIIHTFGWSIVTERTEEGGPIADVYPARTTWLGFDDKTNEEKGKAFIDGLQRGQEPWEPELKGFRSNPVEMPPHNPGPGVKRERKPGFLDGIVEKLVGNPKTFGDVSGFGSEVAPQEFVEFVQSEVDALDDGGEQ